MRFYPREHERRWLEYFAPTTTPFLVFWGYPFDQKQIARLTTASRPSKQSLYSIESLIRGEVVMRCTKALATRDSRAGYTIGGFLTEEGPSAPAETDPITL